jgi:hypothetical protein
MTLPGFNAEASFYRTGSSYRLAKSRGETRTTVVPGFTLAPGVPTGGFLCKIAYLITESPLCSPARGGLGCCRCRNGQCQDARSLNECEQFCSSSPEVFLPGFECRRNRCVPQP